MSGKIVKGATFISTLLLILFTGIAVLPQNIEPYDPAHRENGKVAPSAGDEEIALDRLSLEELVNVKVTTATKSAMKMREVPSSMFVITDTQIKERGYRTLADALHDVPGFDFQHTYGIFPDLIHQRGLVGNNQHLLLYINGVPDNNITENAILGGSIRFPLYNVKRIEIVSGPVSSIYGPNAFNGVINIILKDGKEDPGGEVQVLGGTWMHGKYMGGGAVISLRNSFQLNGTAAMYSASGYYYKAQGPDFRKVTKYDANLNKGYFWSPYYNNSWEDTYNVTARFTFGKFRIQTVNWQYLQGDGTFANGTQQIDTSRDHFIGSSWDFRNNSISAGYLWDVSSSINLDTEVTFRHTEILSSSHEVYPVTPGPLVYYYPYLSPGNYTYGANYARPDYSYMIVESLRFAPADNVSAQVGADINYSVVPKGYGDFRRYSYTNTGAYTLITYKPADILILTAGYRYDYNTNYGSSHTPRASIVLTPGDFTLKLMFSTGFRAPTAWELLNATPQRLANTGLRPERLVSGEIGLGYNMTNFLNFTVQGYYNRITSLIQEIQAVKTPTAMNQNRNVGDANIYGIEAQTDIRVMRSLSLFLNYTYQYGFYYNLSMANFISMLPPTPTPPSLPTTLNGKNIPNIAPHKVNIGVTWHPIEGLSFHIRMNYVDDRKTIFTDPVRHAPGYVLLHGNIRWDVHWLRGLFIQLTMRNILNAHAFDPGIRTATGDYYPTLHPIEGRNIWLAAGYCF